MLRSDVGGADPALVVQFRVIYALLLRDIRTRFFGHGLGYTIAVAWPLTHIAILLVVFTAAGRTTPYGDSILVFFATGLIPFMSFSYMSRFIMLASVMNRPLLAFPAVKIADILIARALLETFGACCMTIVLLTVFWVAGLDPWPRDILQAFYALGAALLLGLGFGIINGIIAFAVPMWVTGYTLFIIAMWIMSGVAFVPDSLPEQARYILSFNPILHGVEWMRSAYYEGYGTLTLDKGYILSWGAGTVFAGLGIERLVRGRLLQG